MITHHPTVLDVQRLIDHARSWSLCELAERVAPADLSGLFSAQMGSGPHQDQIERWVARAKQLLLTSELPVTAIAVDVGSGSGQHFARRFVTSRVPLRGSMTIWRAHTPAGVMNVIGPVLGVSRSGRALRSSGQP